MIQEKKQDLDVQTLCQYYTTTDHRMISAGTLAKWPGMDFLTVRAKKRPRSYSSE